jgi:hypothetical protein
MSVNTGERQQLTANELGLSSFTLSAGGLFSVALCDYFSNRGIGCLVLLLVLQASALICSLVAASRGNKAWLVVTFLSGFFTYQAVLAWLVGDW